MPCTQGEHGKMDRKHPLCLIIGHQDETGHDTNHLRIWSSATKETNYGRGKLGWSINLPLLSFLILIPNALKET